MIDEPVLPYRRNPRRAYETDGREIKAATVQNIRENGATGLTATCPCGHEALVPLERFRDDMLVPDAGLKMRCSDCGRRGVETKPHWTPWIVPGWR